MDFLVHSRATPAAMEAEDDPELDERHLVIHGSLRLCPHRSWSDARN